MTNEQRDNPHLAEQNFDLEFRTRGYLADSVTRLAHLIRQESAAVFRLAEESSDALQIVAIRGSENIKESTLHPNTLATFTILRSAGTAQGAVMLAERGMVVEARTLVRGLIENAFCIGALIDNPDTFAEMFREDDDASRKAQAKFILVNELIDPTTPQHAKLTEFLDSLERRAQNMSIKRLSELGPLSKLYLSYRVLSNDSSHPSATSLKRHMRFAEDARTWTGYVLGPAPTKEIEDTLLLLVQTTIALGVGYTQLVQDPVGNKRFDEISQALQELSSK